MVYVYNVMADRVGVMEGCGSVGVVEALPEGVPVSEKEQRSQKPQSARNKGKERLHRWNRVPISMMSKSKHHGRR